MISTNVLLLEVLMSRVGGTYGGRPDREKRYVTVVSETTADGLVTPLQVVWPGLAEVARPIPWWPLTRYPTCWTYTCSWAVL